MTCPAIQQHDMYKMTARWIPNIDSFLDIITFTWDLVCFAVTEVTVIIG